MMVVVVVVVVVVYIKELLSEFDCGNCSVTPTKGFPVFGLFLDERIIVQGQDDVLTFRLNVPKEFPKIDGFSRSGPHGSGQAHQIRDVF
jgi:hypothetical protein